MPPYKQVFWGILFFLTGIFIASFWQSLVLFWWWVGISTILFLLFFRKTKEYYLVFFLLSLLFFLGAFYFSFYDTITRPQNIPFNTSISYEGTLSDVSQKAAHQTAIFTSNTKERIRIFVSFAKLPTLQNGDTIFLRGKLEVPVSGGFDRYLMAKNVFAVMNFPAIKIINTHSSFSPFAFFSYIHERIVSRFNCVLPAHESALASGLVVGETDGFSKEFRAAMQKSGTTHIVALSGYNVMIIISSLLVLFSFFLHRRFARIFAFLFLVLFIFIAGPQASVIRAAIMAALLLYLKISGRLTDPKNVLAVTALLMTLQNPRIVAFDAGFQLSFLAFIGIVFVNPIFTVIFHKKEQKLPFWKEAVFSAISAQIMALPVLVFYFNQVFLTSIFANTLIAAFVPIAMGVSFLAAFSGFLLSFLFPLFAWIAYPPLRFITWIIEFFSHIAFFSIQYPFTLFGSILYYGIVGFFIMHYGKRKKLF